MSDFIIIIDSFTKIFIVLIQYGMPVIGVLAGIFLGKWIEQINERKNLKKQVYFDANRALYKYRDTDAMCALNLCDDSFNKLHEQQMLIESAKADLEILASDEAVEAYVNCLDNIQKMGVEILEKRKRGVSVIDIANKVDEEYLHKKFLVNLKKWNDIVRKNLKLKN